MQCTGPPGPCEKCQQKGTACIFSEEDDGRRKVAIKRRQEAVDQDRETLYSLVKALRDGGDRNVAQLLGLIRSGASLEEIRSCIDQQLEALGQSDRPPTPDLEEIQSVLVRLQEQHSSDASEESSRSRRKVLDVARISDSPLYNVPASPWTSVTDDNDLVSHLVSVWFTWHHPFLCWIDRDSFLNDMREGKLDCRYCSPFLVNALLAEACPYSDFEETRTKNGITSDMARTFLEEAKRQLDEEAGRITL